jgi:hypothetical protein
MGIATLEGHLLATTTLVFKYRFIKFNAPLLLSFFLAFLDDDDDDDDDEKPPLLFAFASALRSERVVRYCMMNLVVTVLPALLPLTSID